MKQHIPCVSRLALALVLFVFGPVAFVSGQGPEVEGLSALESGSRGPGRLSRELLKGTTSIDPSDAAHKDALDWEAKWVTYRYYYPEIINQKDPSSTKTLDRVYRDFEGDIDLISRFNKDEENRKVVSKMFTERVIVRANEVLKTRKPIARINAARVLAKLAELGQPPLADAFAEMIADQGQLEAVKYYAMKGAATLLKNVQPKPGLSKDQLAKLATALNAFVSQKRVFPTTATQAEIDGYRVVRREAIRALGLTRLPATQDNARPALTLLRAMMNQGMNPETRIDERVAAAIGVALMNPELDPAYNPDYAAQQFALFLDKFFIFIIQENAEKKYPVRRFSSQLIESAQTMNAQVQAVRAIDKKTKDFVQRIVGLATPLLIKIEQARGNVDSQPLAVFAREAMVSDMLFKNVEDSKVAPAAASE